MDKAEVRRVKQEVQEGWTDEAAGWIKHAAIMREWTHAATGLVVDAARVKAGDEALDVASGAGGVAFALSERVKPGGRVVSTDLVDAMVQGAQRLGRERGVDNVSFRQADAESLPFAAASFDVVTCLHGIMFFPRAEEALREFHRVLRPGGRASILAWGPPEANPFLATVSGPFLRRLPVAPPNGRDEIGPFRFAASGSLSKLFLGAGFVKVTERTHEIPWEYPGTPDALWSAVQEISSSLFAWFRSDLAPADLEDASREVQAAFRERYDGKKVGFTATMVLATGERMTSS